MRRAALSLWVSVAAALAGCTAGQKADPAEVGGPSATASSELRAVSGATMARAAVSQIGDSIRVRVEAAGMPPGTYGAHVHAVGRCDAPDFASAGPHWNPTGQQHGKNNPRGMHKGDLPNLLVGTDRRGTFETTLPGTRMSDGGTPLLDADGASIVIHAAPDDYRTDPSGNSGGRIACGVLG